MLLKDFSAPSPAVPSGSEPSFAVRRRAPNGSVADATRVRFTDEQRAKLERTASARGCAIAQVLRDLVDAAP